MKHLLYSFLLLILLTVTSLVVFKVWWSSGSSKSQTIRLEANIEKVTKGTTKKQVKNLLGEEHNFFTLISGKSRDEMNFWVYTPARSGIGLQVLFDEKDLVERISFRDEDGLCAGESTTQMVLCYLLYE